MIVDLYNGAISLRTCRRRPEDVSFLLNDIRDGLQSSLSLLEVPLSADLPTCFGAVNLNTFAVQKHRIISGV